MQSTSMLLIAVCLFASVYSALGMRTVYYRDGQVCDVCADEQGGVPYKQSYTPEEAGRRVIYSGQERIISRPISSTSYIDRADYSPRQACYPNPCGINAECRDTLGRPVCSCPAGHRGDPLTRCIRSECLDHVECPSHLSCRSGNCVNPCIGQCGINADCTVRNHVPVCSCPRGYRGDPFSSCIRADPDKSQDFIFGIEEACHTGGPWGPCGPNTKCDVIGGVPTCSCLKGYIGSPINGCRHECESDYDCGSQQSCRDYKCQQACNECGIGADCRVVNHRAVCECPKNYFGNPLVECRAECYGDRDCPAGRPACIYGVCKNPCDGACGTNADCNLRGLTPVCSCPRHMTGNPFVSCRPFTPEDLCANNPCGTNAQCRPGHDNTGAERPVCTCLPGYTGNPLSHCARGECQSDQECPSSRACINYSCVDPCIGQCGANAICEAQRHIAVCKCPGGYEGNAASSCVRQSRAYYPFSRYYKKK